jgi:hypothetical protein
MSETSKVLVEKWDKIVKSDKARPVKHVEVMSQLLENQEKHCLTEASSVGDIAQYTPILVPAVRRIFPNLLANEIVGVQALSGPTGYAFALRFGYADAGGKKNLNPSDIAYPSSAAGQPRVQQNDSKFTGFALVLTATAPTGTAKGTAVKIGGTTIGVVGHVEKNKVLIDLASTGTHYFDSGVVYTNAGSAVGTVTTASTILLGATGTDAVTAAIFSLLTTSVVLQLLVVKLLLVPL